MINSRLKQLINYLIPHWQPLLIGVIALLVVNALGAYIPVLIKDSINDLKNGFTIDQLWHYVIIIIGLAHLCGLFA